MNVPGRPDGNWSWRCTEEMLSPSAFQWLRDLTASSKRSAGARIAPIGKTIEAVS
jgi:4-alpha-glucanotransferase